MDLKTLLKEKNLDALFVLNSKLEAGDPVFSYFTGLFDYEKAAFVGGVRSRAYVADFEVPRAKLETNFRPIITRPKGGLETVLKRMKGRTVGVNGKSLSLGAYKTMKKYVKIKDVSSALEKMMMVKTPAEIGKIKKAIHLTKDMMKLAKPGKSELDIAGDMAAFLARNRAESSFPPIISYGKNAAIAHGKPTDEKKGCCLMVDIGAKWKGYCADVTRTFKLGSQAPRPLGSLMKEFDKVYEVVQEAQNLAIDAIEPGKTGKEIDKICRGHLRKHGYEMPHSTGHGIGLTIHEMPYISYKNSDTKLEPGMVFTVEPGVYLRGKFGIRIEDDVLVTKSGRQVLSK